MAESIREIEVRFTSAPGCSDPVGNLAMKGHRLFWEYDRGWLAKGLHLSPFTLPLKPELAEHTDRQFGPLFGLFDDSLPDGWGLLLMDRHFRAMGFEPGKMTALDRLAYLSCRTMGALTYHPPSFVPTDEQANFFDLHQLAAQSCEIYTGAVVDVLPQLFRAGGSPAGARPKVLVGFHPQNNMMISGEGDLPEGFEHWLVKFVAPNDSPDAGAVEYAYSLMAGAAGIEMPATRLFKTREGDRFFGARRFDRGTGNRRYHVHTFGNLIQSNFRIPSCDYVDLLKVTDILTRNREDLLRAFRLMVFNVLAHNRDDHAKNFAFILNRRSREWSLAPAYDLTFANGPAGEQSTTVAGEGKSPLARHMIKVGQQFDIAPIEAEQVIEQAQEAVGNWPVWAAEAGVGEGSVKEVWACLSPER